MLIEINITNFAIIDKLSLHLAPGFNALTGETGAGKSIIIDAMGAMLGAKTGPEFIRHGQTQARVEGYFELKLDDARLEDIRFKELLSRLQEENLLDEENYAPNMLRLTLTRELNTSGRSICRINGSSVKQDILREIGDALIDIHGQTEHVSLLRVSEHMELLDQYAGVLAQRNQLSNMVGQLRNIRRDISSLQKDERELARRVDLLKFQVDELTAANLQVGEEEEMIKERQILNSSEKLSTLSDRAYKVLYQGTAEGDDEVGYSAKRATAGRSIQESLSEVERLMVELQKYEAEFAKHLETVQEATYKLEDVAHAVRDFRDRVEFDPARLEDIEERLELIRSLKRKYGNSIPEMLEFKKKAAAELDNIEHSGERLAQLQTEEAAMLKKIGALASEITRLRRAAGDKLAHEVEQSLKDLKLLRARFEVNITQSPDPNGVPATLPDGTEGRFAFDGRGIDKIEYYVSLNPGEPTKPLQKVASGGETSRVMLALKSILASADSIPTLIFDEVDVGVGGRSGQVVGEKLWQLTNEGRHQVICITHLPQVAAFGDAHFNIVKKIEGERTVTSIHQMELEEQVDELAAMLSGLPVTDVKRLNAAELLKDVEGWKEAARKGKLAEYIASRNASPDLVTSQSQLWEGN